MKSSKVYNSILDTVGNTPIIKLHRVMGNSKHQFYVKVEYFNPGGSVKDRVAMAFIEEAEKRGDLKPGGTIIEATSGNTGIGLALAAAVKGYKCIFVMPEKISREKQEILKAHGAQVVITPTGVEPEDPRSHYSVAKKLVDNTPNVFYTNQYHNPDNAKRHYETTGPEIWEQTNGEFDVFVAGAGTGGTISGVGRYIKERKKEIKVVCADPIGSILYDLFYHGKVITPAASYKVEGVGEDMLPDNVHFQYMDDFVQVTDQESFQMTKRLLAEEGLCVGPSSAMAVVGAIKYSEKMDKPSTFLVMLPDSGRAYVSKAFNDEWLIENKFIKSDEKDNFAKIISVEALYKEKNWSLK